VHAPAEGVVMRWCREGELAELWRVADLGAIRSGPLIVSTEYADFEDLWAPPLPALVLRAPFASHSTRISRPASDPHWPTAWAPATIHSS
jgi:hypothetical protein